jgi:hypothetical protein
MKLTKNQLERIFALYQGFGVSPGQQTPEITTDDEGHPSPSIAVHLRGYAIHVNHLGQVSGPPRAERWAAPAKRAWLAEAEAAIGSSAQTTPSTSASWPSSKRCGSSSTTRERTSERRRDGPGARAAPGLA